MKKKRSIKMFIYNLVIGMLFVFVMQGCGLDSHVAAPLTDPLIPGGENSKTLKDVEKAIARTKYQIEVGSRQVIEHQQAAASMTAELQDMKSKGADRGSIDAAKQIIKNEQKLAADRAEGVEQLKNKLTRLERERQTFTSQAGSPYGQFMLANMYLDGEGTRQDTKQYTYWIRRSAESEFPAANYLMGLELLSVDPYAALRHLEKAAVREHGESMHLLGLMHAQGIGVPQSTSDALKWFRLAQAHGIQVDRELLSESGIRNCTKRMNRAAALTRSESAAIGRQLVREIQQRLTDFGYGPGPIDGLFGGKTKSAIQAFQREQGLQPDGQAIAQLLELLK